MKIRKIISSVLAVMCVSAALAMPVSAKTEPQAAIDATFCFDNDAGLSQWETYGSIAETGLEYKITDSASESGDGSLCISENIKNDIESTLRSGGVYISAETVGLESFTGCTMQLSFLFEGDAAAAAKEFTLYSDGTVWLTSEVSAESSGRWSKISLTVPDNVKNDKLGFQIPLYTKYSGNVVYIDNVMIYDSGGKMVKNVGDQHASAARAEDKTGLVGRILLIVLLVGILILIGIGVKYIVSSFLKKFI